MDDSITVNDINIALADSAGSFITIKESIQNILERLKLKSPVKSETSGQPCHHLSDIRTNSSVPLTGLSKENKLISGSKLVRVVDLTDQSPNSQTRLQDHPVWPLDGSLHHSTCDSSSDDVFQSDELLLYGNRLIDDNYSSGSTTNRSLNSVTNSNVVDKYLSGRLQDIRDTDISLGVLKCFNKVAQSSSTEQFCMTKRKKYWPLKRGYNCPSIKCCSPYANNNRSKKSVINAHQPVSSNNYGSSLSSDELQAQQIIQKKKFKARNVFTGNGHIKLAAYTNNGLLTVHIQRCRKLKSKFAELSNAFVKVEVIPRYPKCPKFRTNRVHHSNNPDFDQKFSFELCPDVTEKRLFISICHRDTIERCSEILGCMSFGISNIARKKVDGWYYLLTNDFGKLKHYAVCRNESFIWSNNVNNYARN